MNDFAILLFWFGISATVNVGLAIAWFHTRKRVRQLESRPFDLSQLDDLVGRVDSAMEAVTARIDELANTQDFMNRVLTERLDRLGRMLPAPEPHDTPR